MAVTARRSLLLFCLLCVCAPLRADDSLEVHQALSAVAQSLSSREAAQAMISFSKAYANYDTLSSYFQSLTTAYEVENQVDFLDEELSADADTIRVRWTLTLTNPQSRFTINRTAEISLKAVKEGRQWRIREFSPISFFDPQGS